MQLSLQHTTWQHMSSQHMTHTGQGFADPGQQQGSILNWQQQLQQHQQQGQGQPQSALGPGTSPSTAAADSWGWLDDFEHKQQAERLPVAGAYRLCWSAFWLSQRVPCTCTILLAKPLGKCCALEALISRGMCMAVGVY